MNNPKKGEKMLATKPYIRENAVAYARKFAFSQNKYFASFAGIGGNCTNFVSQCIYAGGLRYELHAYLRLVFYFA